VKTTIILLVVAAIMFLVAGCGPGQPFEIEGIHTPQSESAAHVVAAR
jgi:predicted small lipoprotein YifL